MHIIYADGTMNNFYKVSYTIVASSGVYTGTGMSRKLDVARNEAVLRAYDALALGDSKLGCCSGIAVEGSTVRRGIKLVQPWTECY